MQPSPTYREGLQARETTRLIPPATIACIPVKLNYNHNIGKCRDGQIPAIPSSAGPIARSARRPPQTGPPVAKRGQKRLRMTWSLITEAGIDYATPPGDRSRESLSFPTYAARAADGTYVIAEERGVEKLVPFRFECRTLRIDARSNVLFDSTELGIDDGFGCLLRDGSMALVRRTQWELLIVSSQGEVLSRLRLENFSKRIPRYAVETSTGSLLVVFFNRSYELDLVEIDRQGRLLWYLPPGSVSLGIPSSVQLLPENTILVADSFRHFASEIDRQGNMIWRFGEAENPSNHQLHLSSPNSARQMANGQRVVADTRNHRVLCVSPSGQAQPIALPDSGLSDPSYVDALSDGHFLICDTGNARVIEVDSRGRIVWDYGDAIAARRYLSYPRSVELLNPGRYLVADTGHNRIIEFVDGTVQERGFRAAHALFWPRCVRSQPGGAMLVADARNGRIVEVASTGEVLNQLGHIQSDFQRVLQDPHDVRQLPNDHLLITDSPQDLVLEVDWSGAVHRTIGDHQGIQLKDPHSAQQLDDGSVIISDTGNHRILIVDAEGVAISSIHTLTLGSTQFRLHHPRYAEVATDGTLVIADTGQNRILGASLDGEFLWEFSHVPDSKIPRLNQPRWANLVGPDEILVCDHFHHRIVHVRRTADDGMEG